MSPVTHFLAGWLLAAPMRISGREKVFIVAAAVIPDVDGLGIIPELLTRNSAHPLGGWPAQCPGYSCPYKTRGALPFAEQRVG
jgi:hypothetical protein